MKIGAQLYTVREHTTTFKGFASTIKRISEIGYTCVQVSAVNPEIPPSEIAETCKAYGLEIAITHTNPARILAETKAVIDEHNEMGAKYVGIGSLPKGYMHEKNGYRKFITDYIPTARALRDAGLTLMYHNHADEFERFEGKSYMDYIFENFSGAGFTLDTYWTQYGGGDIDDWLRKLIGRVDVIHIKDYAIVDGKPRMAEVLEGNLNWYAIFEAAKKAGVKYAMVEQDDCYGKDPFDCLRTSLQNLKREFPGFF